MLHHVIPAKAGIQRLTNVYHYDELDMVHNQGNISEF